MEGEAACLTPPGRHRLSMLGKYVGGHGGGDGTGDAVVDDGLTKESVSNGVGFLTWHLVERAFTRRW